MSASLGNRNRAFVLHCCVEWTEFAELINIALKSIRILCGWASEKGGVMITSRSPTPKTMHPNAKNIQYLHTSTRSCKHIFPGNREAQVQLWSRWIQHAGLFHPIHFLKSFFPPMRRKHRVYSSEKNQNSNMPSSRHASCGYIAYPGTGNCYRTEKPAPLGHTGQQKHLSLCGQPSGEKHFVLRNKTELLWSCRWRGPFPWQWGNWRSLETTELILPRACRWQWPKRTHQPFFSAPSTGS